jgi:hypothetical protein
MRRYEAKRAVFIGGTSGMGRAIAKMHLDTTNAAEASRCLSNLGDHVGQRADDVLTTRIGR